MNARTIVSLIIAGALITPAAGVLAAQPFGRDTVYSAPGTAATTTPAKGEITRFGRDTVTVTKDTRLSNPSQVKVGDIAVKPGRA